MKIRADFVTNSSSSSYVTLSVVTNDNRITKFGLDDCQTDFEDILAVNLETKADLKKLIRTILNWDPDEENEESDFVRSNEFMARLGDVALEDIAYIEVGQVDEAWGEFSSDVIEYKWYNGKTRQWYDSKDDMDRAEREWNFHHGLSW